MFFLCTMQEWKCESNFLRKKQKKYEEICECVGVVILVVVETADVVIVRLIDPKLSTFDMSTIWCYTVFFLCTMQKKSPEFFFFFEEDVTTKLIALYKLDNGFDLPKK